MKKGQPCGCGCGQPAPEGKSYIHTHWSNTETARAVHRARRIPVEPINPGGLCLCGCGRPAPRAAKDKPSRGYRKGDFLPYIKGHWVPKGAGNPGWKGGRTIRRGYALVMVKEHPYANRDGYVSEHRLVLERTIGRYLEPHEMVHHINGDKLDNRPENLVAVTTNQHGRIHRDRLPNWFDTQHPDVLKTQRQEAGRKGAASRWSRTDRTRRATKPPKP